MSSESARVTSDGHEDTRSFLSIVVPVFNEAGNIPEFLTRVRAATKASNVDFEVVFAVDPCTDGTEELIRLENEVDPRVRMLRFSRRFGQPAATLAGIDAASGDGVLVMDCDMQDPPELIPEMVDRWQAGCPVVLAQRSSRTGEPALKKWVSSIGYRFINRFSEVPIPENTGDFRLMDRRVVEEVKRFPEANGFLRGIVALVGFETEVVYFDRPERHSGVTKYNAWLGSLKIGFNGVVGFSNALLNAFTIAGLVASTLSVVVAATYGLAKLIGVPFPLGNPTIVMIVLLLGGLNLLGIGVLGLYIGRIYDDVRHRPRYIVESAIGVDAPNARGAR